MNLYTSRDIFWAPFLARVPLARYGRRKESRYRFSMTTKFRFKKRVEHLIVGQRVYTKGVFPSCTECSERRKRSAVIAQTTCFTASHTGRPHDVVLCAFDVHVSPGNYRWLGAPVSNPLGAGARNTKACDRGYKSSSVLVRPAGTGTTEMSSST